MSGIQVKLDRATAHKRLLQHPFYEAWAAGTLTHDDLAFYAGQYWRQVEAFPGYLETIAERLPVGRAKENLEANLADERNDDHPGLWLDFAAALGATRDKVKSSLPETETSSCVESFATAARTASPAFAMGMLYGYESQTPDVADTKIAGLRDHYGIDGPGVAYFELHGTLDVEHASDMAAAIDDVSSNDTDLTEARAGARAGAEAIWGLLDGVGRARNIC